MLLLQQADACGALSQCTGRGMACRTAPLRVAPPPASALRHRSCRARAPVRALGEDFESENPQNVPPPLVVPSPSLSAVEAVAVQLRAAQANNTPRASHGVHTLYEFAANAGACARSAHNGRRMRCVTPAHHTPLRLACCAGSMDRSRYFGFSKVRLAACVAETALSHFTHSRCLLLARRTCIT